MDHPKITELLDLARRVDPEHPRLGSEFGESWQLLLDPVDQDTAHEAVLHHYRHRRRPIHPSDVYRYWERAQSSKPSAREAVRTADEQPQEEKRSAQVSVPNTLNWLMNASEAPTVTYRSIELYPGENGSWEWTVSDHTGRQLGRHRTDPDKRGVWAWGVEVGAGHQWKPVESSEEFELSGELDTAAEELYRRYAERGYNPKVTVSSDQSS